MGSDVPAGNDVAGHLEKAETHEGCQFPDLLAGSACGNMKNTSTKRPLVRSSRSLTATTVRLARTT